MKKIIAAMILLSACTSQFASRAATLEHRHVQLDAEFETINLECAQNPTDECVFRMERLGLQYQAFISEQNALNAEQQADFVRRQRIANAVQAAGNAFGQSMQQNRNHAYDVDCSYGICNVQQLY